MKKLKVFSRMCIIVFIAGIMAMMSGCISKTSTVPTKAKETPNGVDQQKEKPSDAASQNKDLSSNSTSQVIVASQIRCQFLSSKMSNLCNGF